MTWLAPALFGALGALAVPVLLHLAHAAHREGKAFPSLMFIAQVKQRRARFRRLRDPWLLLLRILALTALIAAFAQPVSVTPVAVLSQQGLPQVLVIDATASMSRTSDWAQTLASARQMLESLPVSQPIAITAFAETFDVIASFDSSREEQLEALAQLKAKDTGGNLNAAVASAAGLLARRQEGAGMVHVFSDLQLTPGIGVLSLPESIEVEVYTPSKRGGSLGVIAAQLEPKGVATQLSLQLYAHDDDASGAWRLSAAGEVVTEFAVSGQGVHEMTAMLTQAQDRDIPIAFAREGEESIWQGVLAALPFRDVLILDTGARQDLLHIQAALEAAALRRTRLHQDPQGKPLASFDVVVGTEASVSRLPGITTYVRGGGSIITLADDSLRPLPWELAPYADAPQMQTAPEPWTVARLEPLSDIARRLSVSGAERFSVAPVWRRTRRALSPDASAVAYFSDNAVAIADRLVGKGRVVSFNTSLTEPWSALGSAAQFAPLITALVAYVSPRPDRPVSVSAGEPVDVARLMTPISWRDDRTLGDADIVIEDPRGVTRPMDGSLSALSLSSAGIYRFTNETNGEQLALAASVPASEWSTKRVTAKAWLESIERVSAVGVGANELTVAEPSQRDPNQWVWSLLLLMFAFGLLFIEGFYANRLAISTQVAR